MKKLIYFTFFMTMLLGISSCNKNNNDIDKPKTGIESLQIPDGFLFETTTEIPLSIKLPTSVTLEQPYGRVDIYDNTPVEGGKLLYSAAFPQNGLLELSLSVPAATRFLYVTCFAGTVLVELNQQQTLKSGPLVIDFGDDMGFEPPMVTPELKTMMTGQPFGEKQTYRQNRSVVVNLIENGEFDVNDFGSISDWSSPMIADGRWYITSTLGSNHARQVQQAGEKFLRITSSPARYGGVAQLIPASPGDLITINANVKIIGNNNNISWLFLIARDGAGNSIGYYSLQTEGTSNNWRTRGFAANMPFGTTHVQVLLWNHIYGGTIEYDNIIVTGPVTDSDGDGVDDELDEYPNDSDRAFNVYYPNSEDFGTLAFEDLWPGKGDYDFNDLILDYQFKQVLNSGNQLVEFYLDYQVRAIGASLENGFAIEIPGVDPANIGSISGQILTESYASFNANGTEAGQSNAVIMLFDNAFSTMDAPLGGFGINTSPEAAYVEPVMRQMFVSLINPVSVQQTGFAPYNPFLIVDKTRGREVHLPGKTPTDLHDASYFGEWFDDSDPATGKYYQSEGNLPWAINIPVQFDYPIEKVDITNAYLNFGNWAESGGSLFPDWYKDLSGYRDASQIYQVPE